MGPFRLKEYKRGERVVLERNPFYWKKDSNGQTLPYLDSITFLIIPDQNTEALRFKTGELDLVNNLSPENYADLRRSQSEGGYGLRNLGPGLLVDFLWFNLNRGVDTSGKPHVNREKQAVFEKAEFRRAVSYSLDRQGMARSILLGLGTPQYGPISSGNKVWYNAGIPRTLYDPTRAGALLDQIGVKDSDGDGVREFGSSHQPMEFTLLTTRGFSARERIAQVIQENLAKIGIGVHVQLVLPNELGTRIMESFDYEAILYGFSPIDVAPDLLTDVWNSSGEHHFWFPRQSRPATAWEAQLDRMTAALIRSSEPAVRKATFDQMQDLWAGEMPAIPTVAANILPGWSNRVGNVRPSILAPYLLWNAEELTRSR
jgi:peptide/nickel transport system substrate-binding protein